MLYVKNMVFLDGAIARLAPDLDIIAELTNITMVFTQRHGERLFKELGMDQNAFQLDLTSVKNSLGVDEATESLTYRELQQRRELIQKRMKDHLVG
jgi:ubiquinone biosynthesis protein